MRGLALLALAALPSSCSARVDELSVTLSAARPWVYLGKFAYNTGNGSIIDGTISGLDVLVGGQKLTSTKFLFYCDEEWEQALALGNDYEGCQSKVALARENSIIAASGPQPVAFHTEIWQVVRPHVWFGVIADCSRANMLERESSSTHTVKLTYTGPGGNHLGVDEEWLPTLYFLLTIGLAVFGVHFYTLLGKHQKASSESSEVADTSSGVRLARRR